MADLISREALLKECAECQKTDPRFEERGWANHFLNEAGEPSTEWYCVEDMIENAPTVDAAPVVHGRWVDADGNPVAWSKALPSSPEGSCVCSVCDTWLVGSDELPVYGLYCPACGAKMDGEANG